MNNLKEIQIRIQDYLMAGGLFNPELMEHDKVSQLIKDCLKELKSAEEAIQCLQERLIERTKESTVTAYRDAEIIRKLREEKKEWQDGRMTGRQEAYNALYEVNPDDLDDYIKNRPLADTGDYTSYWDHEKLMDLFDINEPCSIIERLEDHYWRQLAENQELDNRNVELTKENKRLLESLNKIGDFSLEKEHFCAMHLDLNGQCFICCK